MSEHKNKSSDSSTMIFRLAMTGRLPSWNQILAMHHWKRKKFKDSTATEFLFALRLAAKDSLTKTTSAKNTMSIYADTLESYLTTRRNERKLKSAKRNAEKASRKKSRLKYIKHQPPHIHEPKNIHQRIFY